MADSCKRILPVFLLVLCALAPALAQASAESELAAQRALFLQTRAQLQSNKSNPDIRIEGLRDYPLFPYLEMLTLTRELERQSSTTIDDFLSRHPDTPLAEQLRTQWLSLLAENGRWAEFPQYYRSDAASLQQQCWWLEALYRNGKSELALQETTKLWAASAMPDSCDGPFSRWLASDQRDEMLIWKRVLLALDKNQEALARSWVVQLREPYRQQAEFALMLHRDPKLLTTLLPQLTQRTDASAVIALALKASAKADPDSTTALWQRLRADQLLTQRDSDSVRRAIGRQLIIAGDFGVLPWLLEHDPNGEDSYLLEWRLRLALRDRNWTLVARSIPQLPVEMAQSSRWNYWLARALAEQRDDPAKQQSAAELFTLVAKERSFYGFLAADTLRSKYQLNDARAASTLPAAALAQRPAIVRAREFLALGELANARREWQFALTTLTPDEALAAALLAEQWGWHAQTIRTANKIGASDDLRLRFPLGHTDAMKIAAKKTTLPIQWLFAITRQESAFMPDARSSAGALGLMQLMPATAQQVARGERMTISNRDLLQPETNIRLGSSYLKDMLDRYAGNRVLATAAYNGGPGRISRWLRQQSDPLPSDIWIETLPYKETREYVQSVLAFAVIYGERLGEPIELLRSNERVIGNPALSSSACSSQKNC